MAPARYERRSLFATNIVCAALDVCVLCVAWCDTQNMCAAVEKSSDAPRGRRNRFTSIRLTEVERAALDRLAEANERTLAGEVRVAIRKHIESSNGSASGVAA